MTTTMIIFCIAATIILLIILYKIRKYKFVWFLTKEEVRCRTTRNEFLIRIKAARGHKDMVDIKNEMNDWRKECRDNMAIDHDLFTAWYNQVSSMFTEKYFWLSSDLRNRVYYPVEN